MAKNRVWVIELMIYGKDLVRYDPKEAFIVKSQAVKVLQQYKVSNPTQRFVLSKYYAED